MQLPTRLLQRKVNSHKGDFGHILIIAGSPRFSGAAALAAKAAIRAGSGLVTLGIPKSLNRAMIKIKPPEVMTLPLAETRAGNLSLSAFKEIEKFIRHIDVLVIGPGVSQDRSTQKLLRKVVAKTNKPAVIDADGLNALCGHLDILKSQSILTPHPAEMARLTDKSVKEIELKRITIAKTFTRYYNCILVLKGHHTIVAAPGHQCYINLTGNPGMATAGSGDVLSGMIGAFLGQGLKAFDAAKTAVYLHGLAGDIAAEKKTQISLIASDIIEAIPEAILKSNLCRRSSVGRAAVL